MRVVDHFCIVIDRMILLFKRNLTRTHKSNISEYPLKEYFEKGLFSRFLIQ